MPTLAQTQHEAFLARLDNAADPGEFARILAEITHIGPIDGTAPGFPTDATPGTYYNGMHFMTTAADGSTWYSDKHQMSPRTMELWQQAADVQRAEDWWIADAQRQVAERNRRGRPEIGRPVEIRLPAWMIHSIDQYAEAHDLKRAEAIRQMLQAGMMALKDKAE